MMFTVTVHGATALATVVTFQKDIRQILSRLVPRRIQRSAGLPLAMVLVHDSLRRLWDSYFDDVIEMLFDGNVLHGGGHA